MAINPGLRLLFDTSVTICKRTCNSSGGYTKPSWQTTSAGTSYPAHIERSADTVRTETGQEFVARRKVFLYSSTGWSSTSNTAMPGNGDKLILPKSHGDVREPQIMLSQVVSDEKGINHIVLWC